ncbi:MAG: hypothetical protein DRP46_12870, partial [Candidatus Zixiibacteriota bacterium]
GGWAVDDGIAGLEEEAHRQVNQFVGAGSGHQKAGGETGKVGQGLPQGAALRVGVDVYVAQVGQGLSHLWRGTVGILVGVQFDDVVGSASQTSGEDVEGKDGGVGLHRGDVGTDQVNGWNEWNG